MHLRLPVVAIHPLAIRTPAIRTHTLKSGCCGHTAKAGSLLVAPPGYVVMSIDVSEDTVVHGVRRLLRGSRRTVNKAEAVAP